jgi:hypothetical protein
MRADGLAEQFEGASSEASPVAAPDAPPVESQTIIELLATIARLSADDIFSMDDHGCIRCRARFSF